MSDRLRAVLDEAATKAVFEAEWDTVTWEDAKKGYRENDAWDVFRHDHAFYYQAGHDAVTLILDALEESWPQAGDAIEDALMARVGRSSDRTIEVAVTTLITVFREGDDDAT